VRPEYRFLHAQMKLVQLSPQSIESLMNRTGSLPLSLVDLLNEIPMTGVNRHLICPQIRLATLRPPTLQAATAA